MILGGVALPAAQAKPQFRARLAPVPIDLVMQSAITGSGTVTATLQGTRLSLTGSFAGLKTPATIAKIHVGPKGIRGPAVLDLVVSKATSGTIEGSFELTPGLLDDLQGRLGHGGRGSLEGFLEHERSAGAAARPRRTGVARVQSLSRRALLHQRV